MIFPRKDFQLRKRKVRIIGKLLFFLLQTCVKKLIYMYNFLPCFRWPKLDITSSKIDETPKTPEQPMKKKKLFLLDNDTIIDLEKP